ncbi:MAG: arylsulfotransferase family protein [Candidatus Hydrogenedentales bacterium]|jgi:hypothetical protein
MLVFLFDVKRRSIPSDNVFGVRKLMYDYKFMILIAYLGIVIAVGQSAALEDESIPISSLESLQQIGRDPDYPLSGIYRITSDIDASESKTWNNGQGFMPIGEDTRPFTGSLDGMGHRISGLTIRAANGSSTGIFSVLSKGAEVKKLVVNDASVEGDTYVGIIAGENYGEIHNCSFSGNVRGSRHVGLVCGTNGGQLTRVRAKGQVTGIEYVGGLLGSNQDQAVIDNAMAHVVVQGEQAAGGIAGANFYGEVVKTYSKGQIKISEYGGGLLGINYGTLAYCQSVCEVAGGSYCGGGTGANYGIMLFTKAEGNVDGDIGIGGLIGFAGNGIILRCHALGAVTGLDRVGGLAGVIDDACALRASYAMGSVKGRNYVGGLVGSSKINFQSIFSKFWEDGDYTTELVTLDNLITECYSTGDVTGQYYIGGLVGMNTGNMISNSYSTGRVSGENNEGSLIGANFMATVLMPPAIRNCYSTGGGTDPVKEQHLLGSGAAQTVTASFYRSENHDAAADCAAGTALKAGDFQNPSIFIEQGWNFDEVWSLPPEVESPQLRVFNEPQRQDRDAYLNEVMELRLHPQTGNESNNKNIMDFTKIAETTEDEEQKEEIARLQALGYFITSDAAAEGAGVLIYDHERACPGFNLYVSEHGPEAILMDMNGKIIHRWKKLFPEIAEENDPEISEDDFWTAARLLNKGELLVIQRSHALFKLDKHSEVQWYQSNAAHHSLDVAPNGDIYVLTQQQHVIPRISPKQIIQEDFITVLDPDGNEKKNVSLLECFENSPDYRHIWDKSQRKKGDVFHANAVHILGIHDAGLLPQFREGQVLTSLREINTIAVVDLEMRKVVWAQRGPWRGQHDPHILETGSLLLFDNYARMDHSIVYEFDIASMKEIWRFEGSDARPFHSDTNGRAYRLPNGNTLMIESEKACAIEVTPDKEIVWEFLTGQKTGQTKDNTAILFDLTRLPADMSFAWLDY